VRRNPTRGLSASRRKVTGLAVVAVVALAGYPAQAFGTSGSASVPATVPQPDAVPVLQPVGGATGPITSAQIAAVLRPPLSDPALTGPVGVAVADGLSGRVRYAASAGLPLAPASSLKLLTAIAAIDALGTDHRLTTRVVMPAPGRLVLVGGGDATLTSQPQTVGPSATRPASLAALADATTKYLRRHGQQNITLAYDAALFTGPSVNPKWPADYVTTGVIAPVVALMADEGRASATSDERVVDPASYAAQTFADQLAQRGIHVNGAIRSDSTALAASAKVVAAVESAPLGPVVEQMLRDSDNQVAEALGRLSAIADGQPASFRGAAAALLDAAGRRHLPVTGWQVYDASGLSRADRATAVGLVAVICQAVSDPTLAPIGAGLPVAGFTGTLDDRYLSGPQRLGAGVVRAKTGTLTGASAEVGLVVSRTGRLLAFAFVAGGVPDTDAARNALDRAAAALIVSGR
jgi:serine-type D-Ala-D-Ala carboxypeptidase/endopeptidase (penicillin-binding protein 4)